MPVPNDALARAERDQPAVTSETTLANSFLGNAIEIAIVTADHRRTMEGLVRLGIGPWRVYTFGPDNVTEQTYRGEAAEFRLKVCFARSGNVAWELMEPIDGPTIIADHLERRGEGIHHVAYDCGDVPMADRIRDFEARGFRCVQSGKWMGTNHFAFFATDEATTTIFETYIFPPDFEYPEPESWYPAPPEALGPHGV
ncbi:MAG: hypothetical protein AVDCRST_MAG19-49 [uncultured Thermomicrobiales bacterium]|uniref:Methylmalonyl-CoA epimerase n=1 Tax=uncultured Thermomicrobiales bacterium TaxID=1645740 RepID=A0A6J4UB77_9BACT|nr:MAG: hypothetical protein AVDCRST_MAG19-49 [uncultured Thermomicrobiales bacterium]